MASKLHETAQDGYATVAAAMISFAIAVAVSAVLSASLVQLRASQRSIAEVQARGLLDGAQYLAALRVTLNTLPGRLRWTEPTLGHSVDILAEPESDKLAIDDKLEPAVLQQLGAEGPYQASQWLENQTRQRAPRPIVEADPGKGWRGCGTAGLSYYGQAKALRLVPYHPPEHIGDRAHAGEVWRIAVHSDGWTDDRIVRITGNSDLPAITIQQRLVRSPALEVCDLEGDVR